MYHILWWIDIYGFFGANILTRNLSNNPSTLRFLAVIFMLPFMGYEDRIKKVNSTQMTPTPKSDGR